MRGESCHMLSLACLVLFIACNDNLAKLVGRRAHKLESTLACNFPAAVTAALLRKKPYSPAVATLVLCWEAWDLG